MSTAAAGHAACCQSVAVARSSGNVEVALGGPLGAGLDVIGLGWQRSGGFSGLDGPKWPDLCGASGGFSGYKLKSVREAQQARDPVLFAGLRNQVIIISILLDS